MGLSHEALCASVLRLLQPEGRFSLVLPATESVAFLKTAEKMGLYLHRKLNVVPMEGKAPNRVNLELRPTKTELPVIETLTLRNADGHFTMDYHDFLRDFYLG